MLNNQKGFTLIELMVVVVIIGILAAIALPNFLAMQDRAKESEVKANVHTTQLSVEDIKTQANGEKPASFINSGAGVTPTLTTGAVTAMVPATLKNPFNTTVTGFNAVTWSPNDGAALAINGITTANGGMVEYYNGGAAGTAAAGATPYVIMGNGKPTTTTVGKYIIKVNEGQ